VVLRVGIVVGPHSLAEVVKGDDAGADAAGDIEGGEIALGVADVVVVLTAHNILIGPHHRTGVVDGNDAGAAAVRH
jgi:hypothetical protein